jgi:hypothetical protein
MMVALVADLAIKIVTQNAAFLPKEIDADDQALPKILQQTSGLVLIDEIDVHLHPKWQRQVVDDLKTTFPAIQFVCTTHSPQVIGQLQSEEIRILQDESQSDHFAKTPEKGLGMDSSWILENIMGTLARDPETTQRLDHIFNLIDRNDYVLAREQINYLSEDRGGIFPDLQEASSLIDRLELLGAYEKD